VAALCGEHVAGIVQASLAKLEAADRAIRWAEASVVSEVTVRYP